MRKLLALVVLAQAACSPGVVTTGVPSGQATVGDVGDDGALTGVNDDTMLALSSTLAAGDTARVCNTGTSGLRQRSGPGTSYSILRVMPEGSTVTVVSSDSGWYKVDWSGKTGWSSGQYLCKVDTGGGGGGGGGTGGTDAGFDSAATVDGSISIAKAAVGFSYWWGGGRFAAGAAAGACYGSCPNCSHSGSYGADCSGFVAKAWRLPEAMPMDANKHPFATSSFLNSSTHWSHISRDSTKKADALVYNNGSAGHIFLYESGDAWGSMWTYEARGCSYGVVHNLRTAGSAYKTIRRDGY
jgi:hypothetical protein